MHASILIATFNRAALLDQTLSSIRHLQVRSDRTWEVIVIDNNSTDDTRAVVERHARDFPVDLRYIHEARQGRSSALNTGIAHARGAIVAMTDDDVQVEAQWLDAAYDALDGEDRSIAYAGGPVRPIWEAPPPSWLDLSRGDLWGTIAIQDHGAAPFVYEQARKVPLGANMAVRRSVFDAAGMFKADLGRSAGGTILGQEVPELLQRVRAAGYRGVYVPAMQVHHHIPAGRLTPEYFRRWWFGKGVSRSLMERMQPVTELGVDLRYTPHILRVPRYMYGTALRDLAGWIRAALRRRRTEAFRRQMMLAYFAGYVWARQREAWRRTEPLVYRTSNTVTTGR
jgi:glucosyl-dolichyl phosphate glucuronosyltransferase